MVLKELVFPKLLECCRYTDDIFWKNMFEELAYGNVQNLYGILLIKNSLQCNFKKKEFNYTIKEEKDSKVLFDEIISLIRDKRGIKSELDKQKTEKTFKEIEKENNCYNNWSLIKKKNVKNLLIQNFLLEQMQEYNIPFSKIKKLFSIIVLALIFKTLTNSDIIYKDGKIEHIDGIEFIDGDYVINFNVIPTRITPSKIDNETYKISLKELWNKYKLLINA